MRKFSHLSTRYVADRILELIYQKRNPHKPWLTPQACEILSELVCPEDLVLEFGSGRSTRWFSKNVRAVTSIEHSPEWFEIVSEGLRKDEISNVEFHLVENLPDYAAHADKIIADGSIDIALVDGVARDACAVVALKKVRPGGIIVIDDSHRYWPSSSRAPGGLTEGQDTVDKSSSWPEFLTGVSGYRVLRTSSGVSDTTFFFVT